MTAGDAIFSEADELDIPALTVELLEHEIGDLGVVVLDKTDGMGVVLIHGFNSFGGFYKIK